MKGAVHQTKKSNKFECKLCGEKQSIKRHYGIGTAKDCRMHVQRLNGIRGEIDDLKESKGSDLDEENEAVNISVQSHAEHEPTIKSKWSDYVDTNEEEVKESKPETETMYLNNTEVVLEVPKKRKRTNFKCPSQKKESQRKENISNNIGKARTETNNVTDIDTNFEAKERYSIFNESTSKTEPRVELLKHLQPKSNVMSDVVSKFVPPAIHSNSKWAQFIEEEKEDTLEDNESLIISSQGYDDLFTEDEPLDINSEKPQEMFALCDDSDLDSVLNI